MRKTVRIAAGILTFVAMADASAGAQVPSTAGAQHAQEYRHYEGPPVTLTALLQKAAEKNPDLIALRQQIDVMHQWPAQERGLNPPMAEAQIFEESWGRAG